MVVHEATQQAISDLPHQRLWNFFADISQIPRESGNEAGVRNYLINFAQTHGYKSFVDDAGNVIIKAPATAHMEQVPSLALQGHMDMVCVKEVGYDHDFARDPIILERDGDWIHARKTSLGADNGIAIALILDLLSDPDAVHGPLEAIFTVSEETGLEGAFNLDASLIDSRKMLNLDSEEEGVFYIGCAGGVEVRATIGRSIMPAKEDEVPLEVTVDGLLGGHSGGEIHKQRANAITCMARTLLAISDEMDLRIASLDGGTKRNVIPSVCTATILIPGKSQEKAISIIESIYEDIKREYAQADPHVCIRGSLGEGKQIQASSIADSQQLIATLLLTYHGVERMSQTLPGIVETSSNLAVITTDDAAFSLITSHRSSVLSARDMVARRTVLACETAGGTCTLENPYPAWTPNPDLPLAQFCARAWQERMGEEAEITAIHAGLECGIINSLIAGMDSVSLGPDLEHVHSTQERVSIESTGKIADFLRHLCTVIR